MSLVLLNLKFNLTTANFPSKTSRNLASRLCFNA